MRSASDDLVGPGARLGVEALADRLLGGREGGLEEGDEALFLAGVVLVEGLEADVGALDDQLDGDVGVAALGDQLADRAEDAAALIGVGAGAGDGRRRCVRSGS